MQSGVQGVQFHRLVDAADHTRAMTRHSILLGKSCASKPFLRQTVRRTCPATKSGKLEVHDDGSDL